MSFRVSSAVHPHCRLHSTCKDVRSNSLGGASRPFFSSTEVTVSMLGLIFSRASSASASFLNFPETALKVAPLQRVFSSQ